MGNIFQEIANTFIDARLSSLENIQNLSKSKTVTQLCEFLIKYIRNSYGEINDHKSLEVFQHALDSFSEISDTISNCHKTHCDWTKAIIEECYKELNIDSSQREIVAIETGIANKYAVSVDFFSNYANKLSISDHNIKPIDVLLIPQESFYDITSLAIIGHEVGHVYFNSNLDTFFEPTLTSILSDKLEDTFGDLYSAPEIIEIFNDPFSAEIIRNHIQEYICDDIGRRLFGPAFDLALLKLFCIKKRRHELLRTHPQKAKRINYSIQYYTNISDTCSNEKIKNTILKIKNDIIDPLHTAIKEETHSISDEMALKIIDIAERIYLKMNINSHLGLFDINKKTETYLGTFTELDNLRPPIEFVSSKYPGLISPIESLIACTLYFYGRVYKTNNKFYLRSPKDNDEKGEILRKKITDLSIYAYDIYKFTNEKRKTDTIGNDTIWKLRDRKDKMENLVIVPTIDYKSQYSSNAVDLRLGTNFIIPRLTELTHIPTDPHDKESIDLKNLDYFFERVHVPVRSIFTLHPHSFVLASTLEYISIPLDYYALVLGRSSWGRLGLNIATATAVGPGFQGVITLELRNLSETPLKLKVGTRICQLCIITTPIESENSYEDKDVSKYICPTRAEIPKIFSDPDWDLLK